MKKRSVQLTKSIILLVLALLLSSPSFAQEPGSDLEAITAANATRLQRVGFLTPGFVDDVVWSPNGSLVAFVDRFRGIELYRIPDLTTRIAFFPNNNLNGIVESVAFSPNGTYLVYTSGYRADGIESYVYLWDINAQHQVAALPGLTFTSTPFAFSADSQWLATVVDETSIHIWSTATGADLYTLQGHAAPICALAFNGNKTLLASVDQEGMTRLWDMQSQQIVTTLGGTPDYGATLLFGPSGSKLIVNTASGFDSMFGSAGIDPGGMLKVWNLEIPSQPVLLYEIWEADIREVQFSPDEQDLVFTSRSQLSPNNFLSHVHIVELSTGVEQQLPGSGPLSYSGTTLFFSLEGALLAWDGTQLEQVPVSVNSKKYYLSPQQDRVVTLAYPGATRKEIQLYDLATGLQLASTSMLPSMPWYSLAAGLDSTNPSLYLIAAGNEYGHLAVWKIRADSTETVDVPRESFVTGISSQLAFSPNEQILAALSHKYGSCEGVWDLLDLQHSEHITSAAFMSDQDCTVSLPLVVAFHPVNPTIVTGHADGSIRLWNIEQMISVFRIHSEAESESVLVPGDGSPVTSLAYNPYGTLLAYSHENSTTVINVQTNEVLYDLPASGSIVFSPDGSLLVVGLTVFNVRTGQQVLSLPPAQAESAAFSPDGSLLVTTSMLFACLWNVQTGEEVICIPGNLVRNGMIRAVFTPDGKLLVTAGEDGVIRLWGVSTTQ